MKDVLINKQQAGSLAEEQACRFLQAKGLIFLERNYRCKMGEIDLIMREGNEVVFVEVRLRKHSYFGDAVESIDCFKQKKIFNTAMNYLQKKNWLDYKNSRFDIVSIMGSSDIEWIKDAFEVDYL